MEIEIDADAIKALVRDVEDFPKPGVTFKDVTPLFLDTETFSTVIDTIVLSFGRGTIDKVVGIEARGFILAAPVAYHMGAGFVPARKLGKLPGATRAATYDLEYGTETLEIHEDGIDPGDRVLIVDDVLATGGTAAATASLVEQLGGEVVGLAFLIELTFLNGAAKLQGRNHRSLLTY